MILYSIIPPEVVFQGFTDNAGNGKKDQACYEGYYKGERVIVARNADSRLEIVRLLSTRPESFLNDDFQPGHVIEEWELKRTDE